MSAMKENKYDDAAFFAKYAGMHRSIFGLAGAAEWAALRAMLPDVVGKSVLDLGCGYGWHCRYFAENGASCVLGIDLSERMLAEARSRANPPAIEYRRAAMEELDFPAGSFDLVFSSLAFHYVRDFAPLAVNIARWLKRGGALVCSMEHPVFTSSGPQDWDYAPDGTIRHFPVDRYFEEGEREAIFLGECVIKYHRTLTTIVGALFASGLRLTGLVEPQPPEDMLDLPGMRDEMRRPMMLLLSAEKA